MTYFRAAPRQISTGCRILTLCAAPLLFGALLAACGSTSFGGGSKKEKDNSAEAKAIKPTPPAPSPGPDVTADPEPSVTTPANTASTTTSPANNTDTAAAVTKGPQNIGTFIDSATATSLCANKSAWQKKTQTIHFADPVSACPWGSAGNAAVKASVITARIEQKATLAVPANAVICDMALTFQQSQQKFDDEIFIVYNGVVLASSDNYSDRLTQQNSYVKYDWSKLVNTGYLNRASVYCLGASQGLGHCSIPPSEKPGGFALSFDGSLIRNLNVPGGLGTFLFVTTGDDDLKSDCHHSDVALNAAISYVTH